MNQLTHLPELVNLIDAGVSWELVPDDVGVAEHVGAHGAQRHDAEDGQEDQVDGQLSQCGPHNHLPLLSHLHGSCFPAAWQDEKKPYIFI